MKDRSLADLVPVLAIEPDGLVITEAGEYVRILELRQVAQPFRGGAEHRAEIRAGFERLLETIGERRSLQIICEARPVDSEAALATDRRSVATGIAAAEQTGDLELAAARARLGAATEQTIRRACAHLDAAELSWWVVVPTPLPGRPLDPRRWRSISPPEHVEAARASEARMHAIVSELRAAGCDPLPLDGRAAAALLRHHLDPADAEWTEFDPGELEPFAATSPETASEHARELRTRLCGEGNWSSADTALFGHSSGHAERVSHLASAPSLTTPWWLFELMAAPPPWRLVVHIGARDRHRDRRRYRRRMRQVWADVAHRSLKGKLVPPELDEQRAEAQQIDAELRLSQAGIFDISVYLALQGTDPKALARSAAQTAKQLEGTHDTRLYTGRLTSHLAWRSTLPLGADPAGASLPMAARNAADTVPLLTASASAGSGVVLGFGLPAHTLERVDLFHPRFRTHIGLITGTSGSGKTVAANALILRHLARGMPGWIIDRSSSVDEGGEAREAGHYEPLVSVVPGARTIHFGQASPDAILCPWDVPDPAAVGAEKVKFLAAYHTLLIGDPSGPEGKRLALDGDRRALLERGIQAVYGRCAHSGERPRETLLRDELLRMAREEATDESDGDPAVASSLRRLAALLHPYCEGGPLAWLADAETTLPSGAPVVLCDLAGLPDELAGPVMLALVDHIEREVAHLGARERATGARDDVGRAFVAIDELWSQLQRSAATASYLNEWARRTRHMRVGLWLITQHLSDFQTPEGLALLHNSTLRLIFKTARKELAYAADALGLDTDEQELISRRLERREGEYSTCYLDSEVHGRARVRIYLSDAEYWLCSSDPRRDQPVRARALAEAGGDPWQALRLLIDPAWYERAAT